MTPAEVQQRAYAFSAKWANESSEKQESQSFWNDFFHIFGLDRRAVGAKFEHPVVVFGTKKPIDLLWPGVLLVEHKSRKKAKFTLDGALTQAQEYLSCLPEKERPRFILTCDFAHFRLYDLKDAKTKPQEFKLEELHTRVHLFDFMLGGESQKLVEEVQVNTRAAELMGDLYASLEATGYKGPELEAFIIRAMFCMFADHTGIFDEQPLFTRYIEEHTDPSGWNVGPNLNEFFRILNLPEDNDHRPNLPDFLVHLPYVNGGLFQKPCTPAPFDTKKRTLLLKCCHYDWSAVSPAIFGTMFQSVTNPKERRNLGAHYTSEKNILKVIGPLFLDDLKEEVAISIRSKNKRALNELLVRISKLRFLDPACGCGNFLAIAYRELRKLDTEIRVRLKDLTVGSGQSVFAQSMRESMKGAINVDNFYGIEIEEFPCEVARAALWLMDHISNREFSSRVLSEPYNRLPLLKTAVIVNGNALRVDWNGILPRDQASYVLGNPPFVGTHMLSAGQREDMAHVFAEVKNSGLLDYVSAWYLRAAEYIQGTSVVVGFVSTKSITQGEQVGVLWGPLLSDYRLKIRFAHHTFKWTNEASGKAAVHCIIVGFGLSEPKTHSLFLYPDVKGEPDRVEVKHINPYLVDAPDILLRGRSAPICKVPEAVVGNQPIDNGNYLFDEKERDAFLAIEPGAAKFLRAWIGSDEFINGYQRYCLWLGDATPAELHDLTQVKARVKAVQEFRRASKRKSTLKLAETPTRFQVETFPKTPFIVIPEVSSEKRDYIPMGFVQPDPNRLYSNLVKVIPGASLFEFGVLTSAAHMGWTRYVCGRMKSDYRYSIGIVYNNFPWPKAPSEARKKAVETCAQKLLDVRSRLLVPGTSLHHLYDPLAEPDLVRAHQALDRAVDRCYRSAPFKSELSRVRFLFNLYLKYCPPATPLEGYDYDEDSE